MTSKEVNNMWIRDGGLLCLFTMVILRNCEEGELYISHQHTQQGRLLDLTDIARMLLIHQITMLAVQICQRNMNSY